MPSVLTAKQVSRSIQLNPTHRKIQHPNQKVADLSAFVFSENTIEDLSVQDLLVQKDNEGLRL